MAWLYTKFGAVYATAEELPVLDGTEPLGAGPVQSQMVRLPGGNVWDALQSGAACPGSQTIQLKGAWVAASAAALDEKLDDLNALVGQRSYLWITNDGGTTTRKRLARLLNVRAPVAPGSALWAPFELTFELAPGLWSGTAHTLESTTLDTTPKNVTTTNAGNARVRDAVITVTAVGTAITELGVSIAGKSDWHWTGTLAVGKSLVIDCGAKRVTNDGTDAYAGFALQAGQAGSDWLPIGAGLNTIAVHRTGGADSTFKLTYNDGWM